MCENNSLARSSGDLQLFSIRFNVAESIFGIHSRYFGDLEYPMNTPSRDRSRALHMARVVCKSLGGGGVRGALAIFFNISCVSNTLTSDL